MNISAYDFACSKYASNQELLTVLRRYGIVYMADYLDSTTVAHLKAECEILLNYQAEWLYELPYSIGKAVRVRRRQLDIKRFPLIAKIFGSAFMEELTNHYLGQPNAFNHDIFVVKDVVGTEHAAQLLHYDRLPHLKFFIYLTDVTVHNGPLYCIPGTQSYTQELQRHNREQGIRPSEDEVHDLPRKGVGSEIPIEGRAGSLIIFDSDVFHRASTLEEGERLVVRSRSILPQYGE